MTTLVLGGSGATGRELVKQLLLQSDHHTVRTIVRSKEIFHQVVPPNDLLQVTEASVLSMDDDSFRSCIDGCDAVGICLGHNMTFQGMYGKPRYLVRDALTRVCKAIETLKPEKKMKVVLMGSIGVDNPDGSDPKRAFRDRLILSMVRALVPPHRDNEAAAAYLSDFIGKDNPYIDWVVVRPDDLLDGPISEYIVEETIHTEGLFGARSTTRSNVAHFMADLIRNKELFEKWLYKMPVPTNVKIK
jgi:nucleoside-diphosphate-sugar epimerase